MLETVLLIGIWRREQVMDFGVNAVTREGRGSFVDPERKRKMAKGGAVYKCHHSKTQSL